MKRLSLPIILALATSAIAHAQVSSINYNNSGKSITIATEGAYPPFNFTKTDGSLAGFDIDIGMAICEEIGIHCEFVSQDWDSMLPSLNSKKYDAIIAGMSITEERKKQADFSLPYFNYSYGFIGKKNMAFDADKHGYEIGVSNNYDAGQVLDSYQFKNAKISVFMSIDDALMKLENGELDLVFADTSKYIDWLNQNLDFEEKQKHFGNEEGDLMGIATRKKSPLLEDFNKALLRLYLKGIYTNIYNKYF